jgi:hypothetical protein
MNKISLILLILFIYLTPQYYLNAQCEADDEIKVLLVGDSWAFFMAADFTFNTIFERWGHSNYYFYTNFVLSENGAQTDDFLEQNKLDEIQQALDEYPSIEAVHLSIGGNDYLGDWHADMTQEQVDSITQGVFTRLEEVIEFIKDARPGITVVLSGYTYPNFGEVIEDTAPFQQIHPFYDLWEGMGFPTFLEINNLLNSASELMANYAANDPQVVFVNATGILQHTYGQEYPVGIPPGGTYDPGSTPLPLGLPYMPSPKQSMRDYGLTLDCFHLSPRGYRDFIDYQTKEFYHKFLMDDQYLLATDANQNGSLSASGMVYEELRLGASGGETYATALTFHTPDIPVGALVEKAQIFLRIANIEGDNPLGEQMQVKVKSGNFGGSFSLEAEDYSALPDAEVPACRFGSNDGQGHWIRLDLPQEMLPWISADQPTQFIISSESGSESLATFTGVADPLLAPVLNLGFDPSTVTPTQDLAWMDDIKVYPNPAKDILFIENSGLLINKIQFFNILGQNAYEVNYPSNSMDISNLENGVYFLNILTNKGILSHKLVKGK